MGKFRLRLKVQALEVEIDGEREDLPAIRSAISHQLTGLVEPVEVVANGHKQLSDTSNIIDADTTKNKGSRPPRRRNGARAADSGSPLEFRHDSPIYGNPLQSWTVAEKLIWLLYVIKGITNTAEVSGPQLAATFNQHFKQAGRIHPPHVTRDLGKAKFQNPAPLGEDKGNWFLTAEGDRQAQQLIQTVLNPTTA